MAAGDDDDDGNGIIVDGNHSDIHARRHRAHFQAPFRKSEPHRLPLLCGHTTNLFNSFLQRCLVVNAASLQRTNIPGTPIFERLRNALQLTLPPFAAMTICVCLRFVHTPAAESWLLLLRTSHPTTLQTLEPALPGSDHSDLGALVSPGGRPNAGAPALCAHGPRHHHTRGKWQCGGPQAPPLNISCQSRASALTLSATFAAAIMIERSCNSSKSPRRLPLPAHPPPVAATP